MITIKGSHNEAVVYVKDIAAGCEAQIKTYLDLPVFSNTKVRIMPDAHVGKGSVIGFTATFNGHAAPNIIGVDIGCGINAYNLGRGELDFDKLDKHIRKCVPAGKTVRNAVHPMLETVFDTIGVGMKYPAFSERLRSLALKLKSPADRFFLSLGTLGGGNHFIEVDKDEQDNRWLLIHSGSRNPGLLVATYHHSLAIKATPEDVPIKYLSGAAAENYLEDMKFSQLYARLNRALIAAGVLDFFKMNQKQVEMVESIHNYMDYEDGIIRKGAISARSGEAVVIPFSMADGAVIGTGKGNADWNCSAPHGSGRKLSRTQSQGLSMDEYKKRMKHVWSSCISKGTLDESPMAYKQTSDIIDMLEDTVTVKKRLTPIYNFKSAN